MILSAQPVIDSNQHDCFKMAAVEGSHWDCENLTLMSLINDRLSEFKLNSRCAGMMSQCYTSSFFMLVFFEVEILQ